ncbi:hypothetical protein ACTFIU_010175, partial [Dictyostelium citrinum]
NNIIYFSLYY